MLKISGVIFLIFTASVSIAQIKMYGGLEMGPYFYVSPIKSDINIRSNLNLTGVWGGIFGVDINNKWQIETGYFGTRVIQSYSYKIPTDWGDRAVNIVNGGQFGDAFPIRLKKRVNFRILKNNFSFLPSIDAVFLRISNWNRQNYQEDNFDIFRSLPDTLTFNTIQNVLAFNSFQTYLEAGLTLQTSFIIKPLSIFLRSNYGFGIVPLTRSKISYEVLNANRGTNAGEFSIANRMSYLNVSVGFSLELVDFKKNRSI